MRLSSTGTLLSWNQIIKHSNLPFLNTLMFLTNTIHYIGDIPVWMGPTVFNLLLLTNKIFLKILFHQPFLKPSSTGFFFTIVIFTINIDWYYNFTHIKSHLLLVYPGS